MMHKDCLLYTSNEQNSLSMIFWQLKCRKNIVCFIDSEFLICYNSLIEQKERRDNIDNAKGRRTAEQGINGNH